MEFSILLKLILSVVCGLAIGTERLSAGKDAGMKTHALVALGASVFVIISEALVFRYGSIYSVDPTRIASQIVVGIGFLGAGIILYQGHKLSGLSTASGFWVTAAIGAAVGFGFYSLALFSTVLVLIIFLVINRFEKKILKKFHRSSEE